MLHEARAAARWWADNLAKKTSDSSFTHRQVRQPLLSSALALRARILLIAQSQSLFSVGQSPISCLEAANQDSLIDEAFDFASVFIFVASRIHMHRVSSRRNLQVSWYVVVTGTGTKTNRTVEVHTVRW